MVSTIADRAIKGPSEQLLGSGGACRIIHPLQPTWASNSGFTSVPLSTPKNAKATRLYRVGESEAVGEALGMRGAGAGGRGGGRGIGYEGGGLGSEGGRAIIQNLGIYGSMDLGSLGHLPWRPAQGI